MNIITHFHWCGGAGGAALGFQRGRAKVGSVEAQALCLGGIDVDPEACRDFKRLVGTPQLCADLFDRDMYRDFHGCEPPEDWREITLDDVRAASQGQCPDIVIISAPCKGYSRLLSQKKADTDKYKALNRLVLRCVHLSLCAWDKPPALFLIENVPAISTRGRDLLDRAHSLFTQAGYAARETTHCAGEIGGLGQRRKRFLMVARHCATVPALLYEPGKRLLRSIGDVIGEMPPPSSAAGGPMHKLPRLARETWMRLALIPAGKDWRALRELDIGSMQIERYGNHTGKMRVEEWLAQAHTITGADRVGSGAPSIADPRWGNYQAYGVRSTDEPASTITGQAAPGAGPFSIADADWHKGVFGMLPLERQVGTITGRAAPSTGAYSVADKAPNFNNVCRVVRWNEPSTCVTGGKTPSSGGASVADPRKHWQNAGHYGVQRWNAAAGCVTAAASCDNGKNSVADPRLVMQLGDTPVIISLDGTWHRPLTILEMAALQGFDWQDAQGPLVLDGAARGRWQERIGNAIPPPAAEAIAGEMLRTILMSRTGQTFCLSATDRWVRPVALALTVDGREVEV
jgi:site-specific DNA-cytosine methylase